MKKTIFLFFLLLVACIASAQVSFGYDAAGNRISRTIVLAKSLTKAATTDSIPPATEMLGELQVKIYPNPTQGRLSVQVTGLPEGTSGTLGIFTLQGQPVLQGEASSSPTDLDIGGQPAGTYILRINAGGTTTTWKIIKQ
jgi:Secretion system C-terminal sorting domain